MTKPKKVKIVKSETTVMGQLNESIDQKIVVEQPGFGPRTERFQVSAISLEEQLAERIRHYWGERGHRVEIRIRDVPYHLKGGTTYYRAARSNLINGLPIDYKEPNLSIVSHHSTRGSKQ